MGFKMGTSGEQIFPIRTCEESIETQKGKVEINITSSPQLAKPYNSHYLLDFDDKSNLRFTEL